MAKLELDYSRTALVLIDLQKGIVPTQGGSAVVEKAVRLVEQFRSQEGWICFVRVAFHDGNDVLRPTTDQNVSMPQLPPEGWSDLVPELGVKPEDYVVTKRQWGAFFGTDLDLQLRRRGIDTIVLGGISTNIGVEMTAREAFQLGYQQIFVTDAMTAATPEEHEGTLKFIFPRIGKLRTTADLTE